MKYYGKRVYEGIAIGKIVRFLNNFKIIKKTQSSYEIESKRFAEAKAKAMNQYQELHEKALQSLDKEHASIMSIYISLLEDLDFNDTIDELLKENINAEYAIKSACETLSQIFLNMDNDYLKERVKDLNDVGIKLIQILSDYSPLNITEPTIIIADEMTVADLIQINKELILGLILETVSPNAHISILTRSLAIPSIASLDSKINEKLVDAIIDGKEGIVIINPSDIEKEEYSIKKKDFEEERKLLKEYKNKKILTKDGKSLKVYANISSHLEIDSVIENDADGVGLFRSEYIFMNSKTFPTEDEQYNQYMKVVKKLKNKSTIIRTFDIGADKKVDYFMLKDESNPFLGYRGVRLYKEYEDVFLTQLQALYRASVHGELKIMIPMITSVEEVLFVKEMAIKAKDNLKQRNLDFNDNMQIGIMIETPSSALIIEELVKLVDFISIGTNDLTQYTLAMDRENSKLYEIYNPYHPAVLKLIHNICERAKTNNIEIGVCGELARDEKMLEFFIMCGVDEISVSPSFILQCKKSITEINCHNKTIDEFIKVLI